jgi:hypothetical protein
MDILDSNVRQIVHLVVGKLVVKYLETVPANQAFSIQTVLRNAQYVVKMMTATKLMEIV